MEETPARKTSTSSTTLKVSEIEPKCCQTDRIPLIQQPIKRVLSYKPMADKASDDAPLNYTTWPCREPYPKDESTMRYPENDFF